MKYRLVICAVSCLSVLASNAPASGLGWGAMIQGASRGLEDVEDRRAGRYDEIRRRQEQDEYDRQMVEHRRLQEEELRLMREQNDLLRYRILQSE